MSASGNLELALRIKADLEQARSQLAALSGQIDQLGTSSTKASTGAKANAAAITEEAEAAQAATTAATAHAEAVNYLGETAEQQTARIHAMVETSLAQVEADKAAAASAAQAAEVRSTAIARTEEQIAAAQAFQDKWFAQSAAMAADTAALDAILEKRVLTTADVAEADALLDRMQKEGTISATALREAFEALDAAKVKDIATTEAQTAANEQFVLSSKAMGEVATGLSEVLAGNPGRLRRTGAAFLNQTGFLTNNLAITATVAAIAALGVEAIRGYDADQKLNDALLATGDYAGVSAGSIRDMAASMSDSVVSESEAAQALAKLAQSGLFAHDQLQMAGQAAVDFGRLTGQSASAAAGEIERLASGSTSELVKLNNQYHFLSGTQYEWIKQLEEEGRTYDATSAKLDAFASKMHERAVQAENDLNYFGRVIEAFKNEPAMLGSLLESLGQQKTQLDELNKVRDELYGYQERGLVQYDSRAGHAGNFALGNNFGGLSADYQTRVLDAIKVYNQLRAAVTDATKAQQENADAQQQEASDIAGAAHLDDLGKHYDQNALKAKAYATVVQDLWAKIRQGIALPKDVSVDAQGNFGGKGFDYLVQQQEKQLGVTQPRSGLGIDHAQLAADVAAVQNSLKLIQDAYANSDKVLEAQHKAGLVSDADYYQGLREDATKWELDQVAMLEQEKAAAQSHTKTQADRIKADQKVAEIDTEITKVHQDAAAKREQVDADEKAAIQRSKDEWESLRRSMENPIDAKVDAAIAKIEKLNEALAGGGGDPSQYTQLVTSVAQNSVTKAPHYQGLDAVVGGPFGELNKINDKMAELDAWHTQALSANQKFRQTDTKNEIAYQAGLASIEKQYSDEKQNIEQARQQAQLTATANLFGQLASLSTSHNKKMAAIGKAAAIAQTIINTYQSATEAYKSLAGIPYIGPALGIAAAAAAIAAGLANVQAIRSQNVAFAGGGLVSGPGTGTSDSIYARLSNQEYVHTAATTAYYGVDFMDRLNRRELPRYADGGLVTSSGGTVARTGIVGGSGAPVEVVVNITNQGEPVSAKQTSSHRDQNRVIVDMVIATAANDMASGGRLAKATEQRYGLQRRGIPMGG